MKYYFFLSVLCFSIQVSSQSTQEKFDHALWHREAQSRGYNAAERHEFVSGQYQRFIAEKSGTGAVPQTNVRFSSSNVNAAPCTNMDFESGNFTAWTKSTGYNPLYNVTGCCATQNAGAQAIVTGTALDGYGGFPVVCPGGVFSVKLGNNATGGIADRLENTFLVTSTNTLFAYNYAIVINDGGHAVAQQTRFTAEVIDTLGFALPCTAINLTPNNLPPGGYLTSSLTANTGPVLYKPWTKVLIDLSPYVGQNVTVRFTTYDCAPSGHFCYVYLDGSCTTTLSPPYAVSTCSLSPVTMCGPDGFQMYTWTGPGSTTYTGSCITASVPGTYTCQTYLPQNCLGPVSVYTLTNLQSPSVTLTYTNAGPCSLQQTFTPVFAPVSGTFSSLWSFGDNATSTSSVGVHSFSASGSYTVKYSVTLSNGCRDSTSFNVTIPAAPVVSFFVTGSCAASPVTFVSTSSISTGSIAGTNWNIDGQTFLPGLTVSPTIGGAGIHTVTLSVTNNLGCVAQSSLAFNLNPSPVASFSSMNTCDGTIMTFTNFSGISSGSIVSFNWNFGDNSSSSSQQPQHLYASAGIYTVSLTATSSVGCAASNTATVQVFPNPTISVTSGSICAGKSFTMIASGAPVFNWSAGPVVFPAQTSTYLVTGVALSSCSDTAIATVSVHPLPVLSVNSGSICDGQPFVLLPQGASTYTYSNGSATVNPAVTTTYYVSGTDSLGCVANINAVSTVTVQQLPVITVNSGSVCAGNSFTLLPSGGATYTISGNNATVSPSTSSTYSVLGSDSVGCLASSAAVSTVIVVPNPVLTVSATKYSACKGETVNLTAGGAMSYLWNNGSNQNTVAAVMNALTTFTVVGSNSSGCSSSTVLTIQLSPSPTITVNTNAVKICAGEPATLTAYGAFSYTWSGGQQVSSIMINPNQTTTYSVTGQNSVGCYGTAGVTQLVDICEGVKETTAESQLSVYPNPGEGLYTVVFGDIPNENCELEIFNGIGQLIERVTITGGRYKIDLRPFAKGVYYLRMQLPGQNINQKLIKE
jgi:hypothetical protein